MKPPSIQKSTNTPIFTDKNKAKLGICWNKESSNHKTRPLFELYLKKGHIKKNQVDYCRLNEQTIDNKYPIPNISDISDKLGKSHYFTISDLTFGFH